MSNLLPPKDREPLWRYVTEGAKSGVLSLQQCNDCGRVQYPPREICGNCLSGALEWRKMDGEAEILSGTRLHISLEPYFQARLPLTVVSAQLKAGPVLYAFADTNFATGTKVNIEARIDDSGEAVLWAAARPGSGDKS
jgi:uncharacterized OB-fold protein